MTAYFVGGPVLQFFDNNGDPLVGGQVWVYGANTSIIVNSYNSYANATAASNPQVNPVPLNARGECTICINGSTGAVALTVEDANIDPNTGHGVQIWAIPYYVAAAV